MIHELAHSGAPGPEALVDAPFRKVTAIVRTASLPDVERSLRELDVPGISVTKVKGYGEYANFFTSDWIVEHARIEIFLPRERADLVARTIIAAAATGQPGDGIVVVLPVESMYRIRTGECITAGSVGDRGAASAARTPPSN
jgi:nitrogen regulatory protein P-II 1